MVQMSEYFNNIPPIRDNEVIVNRAKFVVSDDTATKILDLIKADLQGSKSKAKTKPKTDNAEKFKVKNDLTVEFEVVKADAKWYVKPSKYISSQKVFKALQGKIKEKTNKEYESKLGWAFKTKKEAEEFAKNSILVTADEANAVKLFGEK